MCKKHGVGQSISLESKLALFNHMFFIIQNDATSDLNGILKEEYSKQPQLLLEMVADYVNKADWLSETIRMLINEHTLVPQAKKIEDTIKEGNDAVNKCLRRMFFDHAVNAENSYCVVWTQSGGNQDVLVEFTRPYDEIEAEQHDGRCLNTLRAAEVVYLTNTHWLGDFYQYFEKMKNSTKRASLQTAESSGEAAST